MPYFECKVCGKIVDDGSPLNRLCLDCLESLDILCFCCKYHTRDFVCHPHCVGCDGKKKFEKRPIKVR